MIPNTALDRTLGRGVTVYCTPDNYSGFLGAFDDFFLVITGERKTVPQAFNGKYTLVLRSKVESINVEEKDEHSYPESEK